LIGCILRRDDGFSGPQFLFQVKTPVTDSVGTAGRTSLAVANGREEMKRIERRYVAAQIARYRALHLCDPHKARVILGGQDAVGKSRRRAIVEHVALVRGGLRGLAVLFHRSDAVPQFLDEFVAVRRHLIRRRALAGVEAHQLRLALLDRYDSVESRQRD